MGGRSKKQKLLDVIIVVIICGLLFFSDGMALGLFAIPRFAFDIVALGALAVAVALTVIFVMLGIKERSKGVLVESQNGLVINAVKEGSRTSTIVALPVDGVGGDGRKDQGIKQPVICSAPEAVSYRVFEARGVKKPRVFPVKRVCPACRIEFIIPSYMANFIVDFGPLKQSNFVMDCPNCHTSIGLKETELEDI